MEPNFFVVTNFVSMAPGEASLPEISPLIYLVEFSVHDLRDPASDPIGVFFYAGMRRYVWRDKFWSEFDLPYRTVANIIAIKLRDCTDKDDAIRFRHWLDMLKGYSISVGGPTDKDMIDNPMSQEKVFHRVLYEINDA